MACRYCNPALYAGLAGTALWSLPTPASALALWGTNISVPDSAAAFIIGCVSGAAVAAGTTYALMNHHIHAEQAHEHEAQQDTVQVHETTRSYPSVDDASSTASYGAAAPSHVRSAHISEHPDNVHVRSSIASRIAEIASDSEMPLTSEFSDSNDYTEVATAYVHHLTMSERMSARARGVADLLSERLSSSRMEGMPVIQRADGSVGDVGEPWWDDALGESQIEGPASQDLTGVQGINDTLLDSSAVLYTLQTPEEVRRAAETTREHEPVQTPAQPASQTAEPVSESVVVAGSTAGISPEPTASVSASQSVTATETNAGTQASASGRRDFLASRIPDPAEAFPAHEDKASSESEPDYWAVALAALDERLDEETPADPEPTPIFEGMPEADTALDEPEALEASTQFILFRPQAGHPEVTDTESYVDLLVNQELSRSNNPAICEGIPEYLHLIEGGTTTRLKVPRHMAAQG